MEPATDTNHDANAEKSDQEKSSAEKDFNPNRNSSKNSISLKSAIESENVKIVNLLLTINSSVDAKWRDRSGNGFLHLAAITGNVDIVNAFLPKIDINLLNREGCTPLHLAVMNDRLEVVQLLLKSKARVNTRSFTDGWTPLHDAVSSGSKNVALIKALLSSKADPNVPNDSEWTPLHFLFPNFPDDVELFHEFLRCGARVTLRVKGRNALHLAAKYSSHEILDAILRTKLIKVNDRDDKRYTPLHIVAEATIPSTPDKDLIEKLQTILKRPRARVHSTAAHGMCPLHDAARARRPEVVKYLIERGAHVNGFRNSVPAIAAVVNNDFEMLELLSSYEDFSWETYDCRDVNPLLEAIISTYDDSTRRQMVEYLLDKGADVKCSSPNMGYSVLNLALEKRDMQLFHFLIERGAPIDAANDFNHTVLCKAVQMNMYDAAKTLIDLGAEVNVCDLNGHTILSHSVDHGSEEIVRLLLDRGVTGVQHDETALLIAFDLEKISICDLLLDRGAIYKPDSCKGRQMLENALEINDEPLVVRYLLSLGADINHIYPNGQTVLDYALSQTNEQSNESLIYLIKRFALLKSLNKTVLEDNEKLIKLEPTLNNVYCQHRRELEEMKTANVCKDHDVTYYDVLTKRNNALIRCLRWSAIVEELDRGKYKEIFKLYSFEIEFNYNYFGLKRLKMMERFRTTLQTVFGKILPAEVIVMITEYYNCEEFAICCE